MGSLDIQHHPVTLCLDSVQKVKCTSIEDIPISYHLARSPANYNWNQFKDIRNRWSQRCACSREERTIALDGILTETTVVHILFDSLTRTRDPVIYIQCFDQRLG